jgi:diamine N-acetyltransferase
MGEPTARVPFRLVPVDDMNQAAALALHIKDEQVGLVASNLKSLTEASTNPSLFPRLFLEGDAPVGFAMFQKRADGSAYIWRVMVDGPLQGRGLGRKLMMFLVAEIQGLGHKAVYISHRPQNAAAAHLFESMGFKQEDIEPDGEVLRCLRFGR